MMPRSELTYELMLTARYLSDEALCNLARLARAELSPGQLAALDASAGAAPGDASPFGGPGDVPQVLPPRPRFWSVYFEERRPTKKRPARWRRVTTWRPDEPANLLEFRHGLQSVAASAFLAHEPRLHRTLEVDGLCCCLRFEGVSRRATVFCYRHRLSWGDGEWPDYLDSLVRTQAAESGADASL
jgi:hypothetical protein